MANYKSTKLNPNRSKFKTVSESQKEYNFFTEVFLNFISEICQPVNPILSTKVSTLDTKKTYEIDKNYSNNFIENQFNFFRVTLAYQAKNVGDFAAWVKNNNVILPERLDA